MNLPEGPSQLEVDNFDAWVKGVAEVIEQRRILRSRAYRFFRWVMRIPHPSPASCEAASLACGSWLNEVRKLTREGEATQIEFSDGLPWGIREGLHDVAYRTGIGFLPLFNSICTSLYISVIVSKDGVLVLPGVEIRLNHGGGYLVSKYKSGGG